MALYVQTPLLLSSALGRLLSDHVDDVDVFLKMETCQPTGSFKMRGVSYCAQQAVADGCTHLVMSSSGNAGLGLGRSARLLNTQCTVYVPVTTPDSVARRLAAEGTTVVAVTSGCTHLVTSSGGNAGLAVSRSARLLKTDCTVFVPVTTGDLVVRRLEADGATVVKGGANFSEATRFAMAECEKPGAVYISPYDHPDVWTGNATLVTELKSQLAGLKPGVLVVSVGGGGLLCGVLEGLDKEGWSDVPVVAMETKGAHCFNLSVKANKIVPLEEITSIAVTLGARTVTPHLMEMLPTHDVISEVVSDAEALSSCLRFAGDHRTLVEPSCGAALSAVYCGVLRRLAASGRVTVSRRRPVVVVVCGGSGVNIAQLQGWADQVGVDFPTGGSK